MYHIFSTGPQLAGCFWGHQQRHFFLEGRCRAGGDSQTEVSFASSKASSQSSRMGVRPTDSISNAASPGSSEVSGASARGRTSITRAKLAGSSLSNTLVQRSDLDDGNKSVVAMSITPQVAAKKGATQARKTLGARSRTVEIKPSLERSING